MPTAASVSIADAIQLMLAAATLSKVIEPERSYADWDLELKEYDTLRVDVVAVTTEQQSDLAAKGVIRFTVPVDIAVRYRFGADKQDDDTGRIDVAKVDELVLLVQEIHSLFTPNRLTDFQAGAWVSTRIVVNPSNKHLREMRQFLGIVRVTFQTYAAP